MRIPGVSSVVAGVTGGAAQIIRAGASTAAGAAGAVQLLASPVVELAGPVMQSMADSTGRALGMNASPDGSSDVILPPVRWQSGQRVHLDLDPLLPFSRWYEYSAVVEEPVRRIPGVAKAHVEGSLGRLVIELDDDVDHTAVVDEVRSTVAGLAADLATTPTETAPRTAPFADPGNPLAILVPLTAAAMDFVAMSAAFTGWVTRLPAAPQTTRAAAALINHQPRMVSILEKRLGRVGADIALAATTAAANGLTQAWGTPMLDLTQRTLQISEATAHRRVWRDREPQLASPERPQAPVVPVISSAKSEEPRHSWAAAAAGDASHVVIGGAVDAAMDTAKGSMAGPVESYVDSAANGSLIAAVSALVAGGGTEDAAAAIEAGVPRAAHMGRQAFATILGRGLANSGQLVLDPGALRRLDRVKVVVIDGAALRGDHRAVLQSRGDAPGWDDDRVYEVADALLHGEEAPEPDPDELPATGARLKWVPVQGPSETPAQGLESADLMVDGDCVGRVEVGWEVDPYAIPLLQTANRTGARVVLRHVAGTEDLTASVGATHPPGTPLLNLVRELRGDRGPVLLITALHRDFASTDTLAALAIADIGVALDDPRAATAWTADIITGTDLADAVRILSAIPVARSASESAVHLAQGGTTLAGLLLVIGGEQERPTNPVSFRRWLNPVNTAAATAIVAGSFSASRVLRLPDPTPQPLTAWHALDPEIVFSRLAGGARPLAVETGAPYWRRRLDDLSYSPALAPLRGPASNLARLASATRVELADPLTPILAVGAAASAIVGSNIDALLVAGVMTVNAITGGTQRLRAEAAAAELFAEQDQLVRRVVVPAVATTRRRLEAAQHATRTATVSAKSLRPGDIIDLGAPEVVPADARLLVADDLEVDESLLTGESLPVDKQVDPVAVNDPDRASMLFEGSAIVAGHARAIVVATGVNTAAHRAISAVANVETSAGVQARLKELTNKVLPLTLSGGAAVSVLALLRHATLRQAVADGVAIAVAAVPEGLPLVATLSQLAAAQRLTARGVLVRSPRTIEALGRVDTICFDKTGTLTENRLRVVCAIPHNASPQDSFPDPTDPRSAAVLRAAAWASPQPQDGQGHAHATDEAILTSASSLLTQSDSGWTVLAEVPFESSRGFAAAIGTLSGDSDSPVLILKGAPEVVLPRCRFTDPDADMPHAESLVRSLAEQGLRVLAVAQRPWPNGTAHDKDTDADAVDATAQDLELLGYIGLADTARASSRPLIEALVDADRNVVLITGDHPITARAVARQLGLPDAHVVTGAELTGLDEDACAKLVSGVQVFARVSPEQKVQIVAALQRNGRVTAMVGDGANDAAAIRMADVGIGVSGRGSSAARGAADIVLTDRDLSVLLDALVEGRSMWAGVRDAVTILVGGNVGEVLFTIIGTAFGQGRAPVGTRQLLLVNLLTDMFPALAVAVTSQYVEPDETEYESDEQAEKARAAHRLAVLTGPTPSLDAPLMRQIISRGVVTAAGATTAWAIGRYTPGSERRTATMGLTALVTTQLAQTLLTRRHSPLVVATALGSAGVLVGIVQTPVISQFFGCTPLGPVAWSGVMGATAGATAISALAPNWLNKTIGAIQPEDEPGA